MPCVSNCVESDRYARIQLQTLYNQGRWEKLSTDVATSTLDPATAYLYLGRAAEGLQHLNAATTYYRLSIESLNCSSGLDIQSCAGKDVLDTIRQRLEAMRSSFSVTPDEVRAIDQVLGSLPGQHQVMTEQTSKSVSSPEKTITQPVRASKALDPAAPLWQRPEWASCMRRLRSGANPSSTVAYDGRDCAASPSQFADLPEGSCFLHGERKAGNTVLSLECMEKGISQFTPSTVKTICTSDRGVSQETSVQMQSDTRCKGFPALARLPDSTTQKNKRSSSPPEQQRISRSTKDIEVEGQRDGATYARDLRNHGIEVDGTACAVGMGVEAADRRHYSQSQVEAYAKAFGNACVGRKIF